MLSFDRWMDIVRHRILCSKWRNALRIWCSVSGGDGGRPATIEMEMEMEMKTGRAQ